MTSQEVAEFLGSYYDAKTVEDGCDHLMDELKKRWKLMNVETFDDITFVVIFLYP